jgi:hypothetical protein
VGVGEVDVVEGDDAAVGEGGIIGVLGDRAVLEGAHRRRVVDAGILHISTRPAQRAVSEPDRVDEAVIGGLAVRERIELIAKGGAERAGVVADLTIAGNPDPGAVLAGVGAARFHSCEVLREQVGGLVTVHQSAVVLAVVERPKNLGLAAEIVLHDVEDGDAREVLVIAFEAVVPCLGRVGKRRRAAAAGGLSGHVDFRLPEKRPPASSGGRSAVPKRKFPPALRSYPADWTVLRNS